MRSLADHIDILNRNTKNITNLAYKSSLNSSSTGPFTGAILQSHLGDLIRDIDPSELGLFSLVQPQRASIQENPPEIERVNFHGATPLRKHNPRHDDTSRREMDPEIYAEAAMKYMDRYKLVRPMPRAQAQIQAILERIPILRQNIEDLNDKLHQREEAQSSVEPDYKTRLDEEELRIKDLRTKLTELTSKRLALAKAKKTHLDLTENPGVTQKNPAPAKPLMEEDEFWNTPAAPTRTLKFSGDNLLMDERADFDDFNTASFSASPVLSKAIPNIFTNTVPDPPPENVRHRLFQGADLAQNDAIPSPSASLHVQPPEPSARPIQDTSADDASSPRPGADRLPLEHRILDYGAGAHGNTLDITITSEVEVIVMRIWTLMSDLIVAAAATKNVELRAKPSTREIIDFLETMREVTPPDCPSTGASDNTPTLQQVLTAALLVGLLTSSTDYSLPLSKVKELLASHNDGNTNASQLNGSRIVYGCVAKRLLKIDRTGSEQIVKFDV